MKINNTSIEKSNESQNDINFTNKSDENTKQIQLQLSAVNEVQEQEEEKALVVVATEDSNNKKRANFRSRFKRFKRYKSIYWTSIIHFSDVLTDYLVLCQYVVYAIDEVYYHENYENINYLHVSVYSFLLIAFNKILSSHYIWIFTQRIYDVILNIFDFYIFKEIFASHKNGYKTDLMQFLQKIEKIFMSSPQFLIQSYVLLRTSGSVNYSVSLTQIASILLSLYGISDKLVSDDKTLFMQASGANKTWPPHSQYIYRVCFRVCEVIANMFLLIIIAVFYGAYIFFLYVFWTLLINFILYRNGLLGDEKTNIISYIAVVVNLGVTPKAKRNESQIKCISKAFQRIISCLFTKNIFLKCKFHRKYQRFLSYYYVTTRIVQGIIIVAITVILFYTAKDFECTTLCPGKGSRHAQETQFQIFLYTCLLCFVLEYIFYLLFFDSMNLGISLLRDTKTLIINYQFSAALRLERIKKNKKSEYEIFEKILKIIIQENVQLLTICREDYQNKDQQKEHLELTNEVNHFVALYPDDSEQLLHNVLADAIFNCHLSMIEFILTNEWIRNLNLLKFGDNKNKNILSFLMECCDHRTDILHSVCISCSTFITGFAELLTDRSRKKHYVMYEFLVVELGEIVIYLSTNYWNTFVECKVIKYIFDHELNSIIQFIKIPKTDGFKTLNKQMPQALNIKYLTMLIQLLTNHMDEGATLLNINKYKLNDSVRYDWFDTILKWGNYKVFCDFLQLNPHINSIMLLRPNIATNPKGFEGSFLGMFVNYYHNAKQKHPDILEWARFLILTFNVDIHQPMLQGLDVKLNQQYDGLDESKSDAENPSDDESDDEVIFDDEEIESTEERITPIQLAVHLGYEDLVQLMLQKGNIDPLLQYAAEEVPTWGEFKARNKPKPTKLIDLATTNEMVNLLINKVYECDDMKEDKKQESIDEKMDETWMNKNEYETVLLNRFDENNFALFDILIEYWNKHHQEDKINLFDFDEQSNLLQLIGDKYGDGRNEKNLAAWFTIFEKYYHQIENAFIVSNYQTLLIQNCSHNLYSFVYKLTGLCYLANDINVIELAQFWSEKLFPTALKQDNGLTLIDRILTFSFENNDNISVKDFSININDINDVSCEYFNLVFAKHKMQLNLLEYDANKIINNDENINLIKILELKSDCMNNSTRKSVLAASIKLDNVYFLDHWLSLIDTKGVNISDLMRLNTQTITTKIKSNEMIECLMKYGWNPLEVILKKGFHFHTIPDVLLQYTINNATNLNDSAVSTPQLHHLISELNFIKGQNLCYTYCDKLYMLLAQCDKELQQKFSQETQTKCTRLLLRYMNIIARNEIEDDNKEYKQADIVMKASEQQFILYWNAKLNKVDEFISFVEQNKIHNLLNSLHLWIAVENNNLELVKYLSAQETAIIFLFGHTNLESFALRKGHKEIIHIMRQKGLCRLDDIDEDEDKDVDIDPMQNELERKVSNKENEIPMQRYEIPMQRIENSLLKLYQRYSRIGNKDNLLFDLICDPQYFCNKGYKYSIHSNIVGTVQSTTSGIYLFHSILSNNSMSNTFRLIMEERAINNVAESDMVITTNNDNNRLLMLVDKTNRIPIECVVFGSYNKKYEVLRFKVNVNQSQLRLIEVLHRLQHDTIRIKLNNIL